MKSNVTKYLITAGVVGFLSAASLAPAQTTTVTTTAPAAAGTTCAGTISEFGPSVITVRSTSGAAPVSYSYSKTTTYVDQDGNPVSMETVKSGMPVTVYYTKDGDQMIASKVVVQRTSTTTDTSGATVDQTTVKKTTTTTTTPQP